MKIVGKIMKWLGIGISTLLVLIILAALIMNVIFGRELRQTMEKLKAEGRALTIAEIRPASIPDDQNAAPLLQKAAELMGHGSGTNPPQKAAAAIKELSDLISSNLGPWIKKDFTVYLKLMSEMQDYYKVPYYQVAATIRDHPTVSRIPKYCFLAKLLFPNLKPIVTKDAEHDAAIAVARVGLGLKLFKQKNGAYPDMLDKLTPEFLDTIPVDPFTGKALIYRKADAGFILYSLGPNQQDDNGTPRPTDNKATGKEPYDIVWKCTR